MKSYTRATGINCGSIFFRTPAELLEPLVFPKKCKGVIQRLNLIPVKSHDGHTFYEYESHTCSAHDVSRDVT